MRSHAVNPEGWEREGLGATAANRRILCGHRSPDAEGETPENPANLGPPPGGAPRPLNFPSGLPSRGTVCIRKGDLNLQWQVRADRNRPVVSRFFQDPGLQPQDDIGFPFLHPEHNNQARRPGRGIAQVSNLLSRGLISDRNPSKRRECPKT